MAALTYIIAIIIVIGFSAIAYWRGNPVIFMCTAGVTMMVGLYTPDALTAIDYSRFGVGIGLMIITYSFICIALAFANIVRGEH